MGPLRGLFLCRALDGFGLVQKMSNGFPVSDTIRDRVDRRDVTRPGARRDLMTFN